MVNIIETLKQQLESEGIEAESYESGVVRFYLEGFGDQKDGAIMTEVMALPTQREGNFHNYLLYSTVLGNISPSYFTRVKYSLNEINVYNLSGNYGLDESTGVIYHKQVVKLFAEDIFLNAGYQMKNYSEAGELYQAMAVSSREIQDDYDILYNLASGDMHTESEK